MASVSSCTAQNTCMICLSPLLVPNAPPRCDGSSSSTLSDDQTDPQAEIGSVFPCGHVFHLTCFNEWTLHEQRCPTCNQDANLFCKLFLSVPPAPPAPAPPIPPPPPPPQTPPAPPPVKYITVASVCDSDVAPPIDPEEAPSIDLDQDDDKEQRQILVDLRTATQAGPAQAIRKVVSLRSKLRKLRRDNRETKSELESTRLVLDITQEELQLAQREASTQKTKVQEYSNKLDRIKTLHWERHKILKDELMHRHSREVQALQKELQDVKMELALRNRQLTHCMGGRAAASDAGVAVGHKTRVIQLGPEST